MHPGRPATQPVAEARADPSSVGSVILDIGEGIGAAVVKTTAALAGAEIEIRPEQGQWTGTHVAVLERRVKGGPVYAAVFPALPAGRYHLRVRAQADNGPVHTIAVQGGQVLTTAWPHP